MKKMYVIPGLISISFISGIYLGELLPLSPIVSAVCLLFFLLLLSLVFHKSSFLFFLGFILSFFLTGSLARQMALPKNNPSLYIHHSTEGSRSDLQIKIRQRLKSGSFQENYIAEVTALNHKPTKGKILVSIPKESNDNTFQIGDKLSVWAAIEEIPAPLNPDQFDYRLFMNRKKVWKRIRLENQDIHYLGCQKTLGRYAEKIRTRIEFNLVKSGYNSAQVALMEALLLGQRIRLEQTTYEAFIGAGVVHLLAVSGLHVGILLGILLLVTRPLSYWRYGAVFRLALIILCLWMYAFITGLSPSVIRAVAMFSLLSIGLGLKRRALTANLLLLSGFILLLFNPNLLFDVGFQMSYLAVLGILVFYRKIARLFKFKNKAARYFWNLASLTLSAQIGVVPLSLFYFHQFPGLFFLANLLIIPVMGIVLGVGIGVVLLTEWGIQPEGLRIVYGSLLTGIQAAVEGLARQERFIFKHLYFSRSMFWIAETAILFFALAWHYKKVIFVYGVLLSLMVLQLNYIADYHAKNLQSDYYWFHRFGTTVGARQNGHDLKIFLAETDSSQATDLSFLDGFINNGDFKRIQVENLDSLQVFETDKHRLLIINGLRQYPNLENHSVSHLILTNNPRLNIERLISELRPLYVIADGNNYFSFVETWRSTAQKHEVNFHYTGQEGYFLLSGKN